MPNLNPREARIYDPAPTLWKYDPPPNRRFQYLSQHSCYMTGCGYGTTGAEAAAGSRGRVLAVDHGWGRHGRGVPAGWDHAQDRLPVACRTRGSAAAESVRGGTG